MKKQDKFFTIPIAFFFQRRVPSFGKKTLSPPIIYTLIYKIQYLLMVRNYQENVKKHLT